MPSRCPNGTNKNRLTGKCEAKKSPQKGVKESPRLKSPIKSSTESKWVQKFCLELENTIKFFNKDDYVLQYKGKTLSEKSLQDLVKKNKKTLLELARKAYMNLGADKSYESDYPKQVLHDSKFFAKHKLEINEK